MDAMQLHDLNERMLAMFNLDIANYRNEKLIQLRKEHPDDANVIVVEERNKLILEITTMRETALKAYEFISEEAAKMRRREMTGAAPDTTNIAEAVANYKPW